MEILQDLKSNDSPPDLHYTDNSIRINVYYNLLLCARTAQTCLCFIHVTAFLVWFLM